MLLEFGPHVLLRGPVGAKDTQPCQFGMLIRPALGEPLENRSIRLIDRFHFSKDVWFAGLVC